MTNSNATNNRAPKRNSSPARIATLIVVVLGAAALGLLAVLGVELCDVRHTAGGHGLIQVSGH